MPPKEVSCASCMNHRLRGNASSAYPGRNIPIGVAAELARCLPLEVPGRKKPPKGSFLPCLLTWNPPRMTGYFPGSRGFPAVHIRVRRFSVVVQLWHWKIKNQDTLERGKFGPKFQYCVVGFFAFTAMDFRLFLFQLIFLPFFSRVNLRFINPQKHVFSPINRRVFREMAEN